MSEKQKNPSDDFLTLFGKLMQQMGEYTEMKSALQKIRDMDYRGNRCRCSEIAERVLREMTDE